MDMWKGTLWIYQYAGRYRKAMILYTLLGLAGTAVSLAFSLISRDMVDVITGQKAGLLAKTFCLYIGFSIGNILLAQFTSYFSSKISLRVDQSVKADIFEKILDTDLESIQNYHTGDLLTRWSSDASAISNGILNFIPNAVIYTVRFACTFALVFYHDPSFAFLALLGIPVSILMSRRLLRRMKNNNRQSAAMNARMSGFNQEAFSNIQTIKAFDLVRLYSGQLRLLQSDYLKMKMDFQKLSMAASIIMSLAGLAVSYSCYGFGIYRVWTGAISYGTMTMFLSLSGSLTGTVNQLVSLVPAAVSMTTSAGRLMDILDMPRDDISHTEEAAALWNRNLTDGLHLKFEDLTYAYHNGTPVFLHASFEAHPHEIVALVGPSGEGKTTMLRLILALLHPQGKSGRIYGAEEADAMEISPSTRRLFSYVPQGNTMFSGTIAENIRSVRPDASDDEIVCALKTACAWEFVAALPQGIYSRIGERGSGFSEGQSQRLSIARALLRRSPFLLLDEATSALDVKTEREVLRNLMQDELPRTCIVTTHRPTVLTMCRRVYGIREQRLFELEESEVDALQKDF